MPYDVSQAVAARAAVRQAKILGKPQRIPPLTPDEYTEEALVLTASIDAAVGLTPDAHVSEWIATVMRYPKLFRAHTALAVVLMSGGMLPARDRELAVLRTGWLCEAPFEWSGHVELGKRVAGISTEEVEWVTVGSAAPGWGEHDRAVLRAVEELLSEAMISDGTWAVLAKSYDECQLMELPILVGQYLGVAFLQNSLRVPLPAGYEGLFAR
jgi:alkylhydroperoxidase family enzyme